MKEQNRKNPLGEEKTTKLLRQFAVPSIISMLVGSLYNIVDQFFIGRSVGELGNAATNIAFPLSIACVATALLFGIGGASAFNIAMGRGKKEKAVSLRTHFAVAFTKSITAFSNTKVWWICEKGHEWEALISTRSNGSQCPYCSGIEMLPGYNDLATTHPQLVKHRGRCHQKHSHKNSQHGSCSLAYRSRHRRL